MKRWSIAWQIGSAMCVVRDGVVSFAFGGTEYNMYSPSVYVNASMDGCLCTYMPPPSPKKRVHRIQVYSRDRPRGRRV